MKFSSPIHLVAARRSPIGRLGGALQALDAADLATQTTQNTLPTPDSALAVQRVIFGQGLQAGAGMNVARQIALRAGCPQTTPAYTVNMVCGSGLQAVALAAREIADGEADVALAGGVESMSNAPHYARLRGAAKFGDATLEDAILRDGLTDPLHNIVMGETAEILAQRFDISRAEQDRFALQSQQRAIAATSAMEREIVPVRAGKNQVCRDEGPRADSTLEKLASLRPVFRADGTVTAGNSSTLNDGAACVLLASETALQQNGWQSRARLVGVALHGCDPRQMGLGPVGAIRNLCEQIGWNLDEVDCFEINEAFAAQTLACLRELPIDPAKLNRRGGAIALGHPIGCSGARVLVTLLHLLEDRGERCGIAALCIGGGMGITAALER